jgi:signal transduction histidine kinase
MATSKPNTPKNDTFGDLALPGMIHDLNNVFQNLVEAADLLSDDPRWSSVSASILRSIERGKEITMSMYAIGEQQAFFQTVLDNATAFVQDSVVLRQGPEIRFDSIVEPGLALRHPWAWERVLINLFLNSVRAMPGGGTISSHASRNNGDIQIVVADDGGGIAPELLPVIFEPHVSTKPLGGLGLHIVHSIVKREQGEVRVANREGGGAVFTITIPARLSLTRTASA